MVPREPPEGTPFSDTSAGREAAVTPCIHGKENAELVDFDWLSNPANHVGWSSLKKFMSIMTIALLSATGQIASSMVAPSVTKLVIEFRTTKYCVRCAHRFGIVSRYSSRSSDHLCVARLLQTCTRYSIFQRALSSISMRNGGLTVPGPT